MNRFYKADALGYPIEFYDQEALCRAYPKGYGFNECPSWVVSDDTQMTLFLWESIQRSLARVTQEQWETKEKVAFKSPYWQAPVIYNEPLSVALPDTIDEISKGFAAWLSTQRGKQYSASKEQEREYALLRESVLWNARAP